MKTFDVCLNKKSFKLNNNSFKEYISPHQNFLNKYNTPMNYSSHSDNLIDSDKNAFISLVQLSFDEHRHLILDPDSVWLTIENGLAIHIKENAEALRKQFVDFDGKEKLIVYRMDFDANNNEHWESVFNEFSDKIGSFIGKKKDLIVANFSTTGTLQRVSSEIVLMDAMSEYFSFECHTLCGIPSVTLEGTVEDWENIRDRVNNFCEFGLDWWVEKMIPVLDEFVNAAKGNHNVDFWYNFYNEGGGSGGPYISGHVLNLFPYFQHGEKYSKNDKTVTAGMMSDNHVTTRDLPPSFSKVPFKLDSYHMELLGGIIGVQEHLGAVRAAFGWGVCDDAKSFVKIPIDQLKKNMAVYHRDGRVGKLLKAEMMEYPNNPEWNRLSDVKIEWEDGKVEDITWFYDLYVKDFPKDE